MIFSGSHDTDSYLMCPTSNQTMLWFGASQQVQSPVTTSNATRLVRCKNQPLDDNCEDLVVSRPMQVVQLGSSFEQALHKMAEEESPRMNSK